jgi:chromosome segregation ATPase
MVDPLLIVSTTHSEEAAGDVAQASTACIAAEGKQKPPEHEEKELSIMNDVPSESNSMNDDPTNQENEEEWIPPTDLSALKLSRESLTSPTSVDSGLRRRALIATGKASNRVSHNNYSSSINGTPLMSTDNNQNSGSSGNISTPTMNHSITSPESNASSSAKASYLARKAQRYSSLKRRKNPNNLLHRLFCQPLETNASTDDFLIDSNKEEAMTTPASHSLDENEPPTSMSTRHPTSQPDNHHGRMTDIQSVRTEDEIDAAAGCVSLSQTLWQQASENLTLHEEAKVRETIQTSIHDALLDACHQTAFETTTTTNSKGEDDCILLETKNNNISMLDDEENYDDITEANRPIPNELPQSKSKKVTTTPITKPTVSTSKSMRTPGGLIIPSPFALAGTIFPSAFDNFYGKSSTHKSAPASQTKGSHQQHQPDDAIAEGLSTEVRYTEDNNNPPTSPHSMVHLTLTCEDLSTVPEVSSSKENSTVSSVKSKETDEAEDVTNGQPIDEKSFSERLEKAKKHWERELGSKIRKEIHIENEELIRRVVMSSSSSSWSEDQDKSEVSKIVQELKAKYERKINEQRDQIKMKELLAQRRQEEIEHLEAQMDSIIETQVDENKLKALQTQLAEIKREKEIETQRLRAETESLKAKLKAATEVSVKKSPEVVSLTKELQDMKKKLAEAINTSPTKRGELQCIRRELAETKAKLEAKEKESKQATSPSRVNTELHRVKKELAEVKEQLASREMELASRSDDLMNMSQEVILSTSHEAESELARVKHELTQLKASYLAEKHKAKASDDGELKRIKQQLAAVTQKLAEKEQELAEAKTDDLSNSGTPTRANRIASRSPPPMSPLRSRFASSGTSSKKENEIVDVLEKEKENLRKQIECLEQQAATAKKDHEQALVEVQKANESEKRDLENKLEQMVSKMTESKTFPTDNSRESDESEKENLREQIRRLEQQAAVAREEHEKVLAELRQSNEVEMQLIRQEMDAKLMNHESGINGNFFSRKERDELLAQIDRLQNENVNGRVDVSQESQKNEELMQRISALEMKEKDLVEEHERLLRELRSKNDEESEKLRAQIEERETLCINRATLLEQELSKANVSHSEEIEELMTKIKKLEALLEAERLDVKTAETKILNMNKEMEENSSKYNEDLNRVKTSTSAEISRLKIEIEERSVLEETMNVVTTEKEKIKEELEKLMIALEEKDAAHRKDIGEITKKHSAEIKKIKNDHSDLICELEAQTSSQLKELQEKCEQRCEQINEHNDEKVEALLMQHKTEAASLKKEIGIVEEQYKTMLQKANDATEILRAEFKVLEDSLNQEVEKFSAENAQLKSAIQSSKELHEKQFEEVLSQLEEIESDYRGKLAEKETIISALGSQLNEAQKRLTEVQNQMASEMKEKQGMKEKYDSVLHQLEAVKVELFTAKENHAKFVKEATIAQERACDRAREEMIEKAEIQFKQANDHYIKLRKQYDASQDKLKKLESELKLMKSKLSMAIKDKEANEVDLKAEIAELSAKNARKEAEAAQKAKEYRREMECLLQTAKDFEKKAEEEEQMHRKIQAALDNIVTEKEKLQREYEEMKSVSEELMAIVEEQERHQY